MEVVPTFLLVHITLVKEAKVEVLGAGGGGRRPAVVLMIFLNMDQKRNHGCLLFHLMVS